MKVKILFFGSLAEKTGVRSLELEGIQQFAAVKLKLMEAYPVLKNLSCIYALNLELVKEDNALRDGDEIAVMPPFAGG